MDNQFRILAINPGSTSTKIAVYRGDTCEFEEVLRHNSEELSQFSKIYDQYDFRRELVEKALTLHKVNIKDLDAVVGRGGPLRPMASGTYTVNDRMCEDLKVGVQAEHASNLGGLIARGIADQAGIPSFIVDPVSVDEMEPIARITGVPEISRRSLFHALNLKAVAHRVAKDLHVDYSKMNLVMAHLGGGISIGIQSCGKMIDVSNANENGPFSPERAGYVPAGDLVKMCYSGKYSLEEMKKKLVGKGGLVAHLGINDGREVEKRIIQGDKTAALVYEAMAYNVAKEIGAMSTVLRGELNAIVLTGGLAYSKMLVEWITNRVKFIAPVLVYPGEDELQALVEGIIRVLNQEEEAKIY